MAETRLASDTMIELVIPYRDRSIGTFNVRRVLPYVTRRAVGPFVFVDDFGPVEVVRDESIDVLAHPHIGLATVTYLLKGKMTHRDSLGTVQVIEPGEVNWMSAGRGIVHSERVSDAGNASGETLSGVQTWVALPEGLEESDPDFAHYSTDSLRTVEDKGLHVKLITGELFGAASAVRTVGNPVYAECDLAVGAALEMPTDVEERSVYILTGELEIDGVAYAAGNMVVFKNGADAAVRANQDTKFLFIGGDRLDKPRFMWWNFVSSRQELIEQARQDWKAGNFTPITNESGFVPLPEGNFPRPQPL